MTHRRAGGAAIAVGMEALGFPHGGLAGGVLAQCRLGNDSAQPAAILAVHFMFARALGVVVDIALSHLWPLCIRAMLRAIDYPHLGQNVLRRVSMPAHGSE